MQKTNISEYCGNKIREFRKKKKFTQEELASAIGLQRPSVCNIELGYQSLTVETLLMSCAVLGCKASDILPPIPKVELTPIIKKEKVKIVEMKSMKSNFKW